MCTFKYCTLAYKGALYNVAAGRVKEAVGVKFQGLVPFTFPFRQGEWFKPSYRRYDLWLRHSLDPNTSTQTLKSVFAVRESASNRNIPFDLELVDKVTLRLESAFLPSTKYQIVIRPQNPNQVLDGFGLPLQEQMYVFETAPSPSYIIEQSDISIFEGRHDILSHWNVLTQGPTDSVFSLAKVTQPNIESALAYKFGTGVTPSFERSTFVSATDNLLLVQDTPIPSTLFLRELHHNGYTNFGYAAKEFSSVTDLCISAIASGTKKVFVWVTRFSSGVSIPGVQVTLYNFVHSRTGVTVAATGTTASDGTVELELTSAASLYGTMSVGAVLGDEIGFLPNIRLPSIHSTQVQGAVVTDRSLYRVGDTVHVKAYLRTESGTGWQLPLQGQYNLRVIWRDRIYNSDGSSSETSNTLIPVTWTAEFGSFSCNISIPANAQYGDKTVDITDEQHRVFGSAQFTIADPRRPTATMVISAPNKFYRPGRSAAITAEVLTGTKLPIEGAEVSLRWQVVRAGSRNTQQDREDLQGFLRIHTNVTGKGEVDVDLDSLLSSSPVVGDELTISASYNGPTGEVIESSVKLPVRLSDWTLEIEPSIAHPLPGFSFGAYFAIRDMEGEIVDQNVDIQIALYELIENSTATSTSASQPKQSRLISTCAARSSVTSMQCAISLPSTEQYKLVASWRDGGNFLVTTEKLLGKSMQQWLESPLDQAPSINLRLDQRSYSVGDTVKVTFFNPYEGSALLFRWGNQVAWQTKQVTSNSGLNSHTFVLTNACASGCSLTAILSIPRQPASKQILPVQLPVSKSLDLHAPRWVDATISIPMSTTATALRVNLQPRQGVWEPGQTVDFTVSLRNAAGANVAGEVAVFVVDKALFDLKSHPTKDLNEVYRRDLADPTLLRDSREYLSTKSYCDTMTKVLQRRSAEDPWIYPYWPMPGETFQYWQKTRKRDIDKTDKEYFAGLTTQITDYSGIPLPDDGQGPPIMYNVGVMESSMVADSAMMMTTAAAPSSMMKSDSGLITRSAAIDHQSGPTTQSAGAAAPSATYDFKIRSNFEDAPFFAGQVRVGRSEQRLQFALPDNVGRFSIRVYAVDNQHTFGSQEVEIVSRKSLNLEPALPRIARFGDTFEAGVTVASSDPFFRGSASVTAAIVDKSNQTIAMYQPVSFQPGTPTSTAISLQGTTPTHVKFLMKASSLGEGTLRFFARAGTSTDALETKLPVPL